MPISKSAKKSERSAEAKASLNRYRKALIKDALKDVTGETVDKAVSMIDKGAKWGLFHKNRAARMKSNLSKRELVSAKAPTKKTVKPTKDVKSEARSSKSETKPKPKTPKAKK